MMKKIFILTFLLFYTQVSAEELEGVWVGIDSNTNSWAKLTVSKKLESTIELLPLGSSSKKVVIKKVKVLAPNRKGMNFDVKLQNLGILNSQFKIKEFNLSYNKKLRYLKIDEKITLNVKDQKIDLYISMNLVPLKEFKKNYKSLIEDKDEKETEPGSAPDLNQSSGQDSNR